MRRPAYLIFNLSRVSNRQQVIFVSRRLGNDTSAYSQFSCPVEHRRKLYRVSNPRLSELGHKVLPVAFTK